MNFTQKVIKSNDIEPYTESFGSENNPAILLVAGATVSMLYWEAEFCQRLAEKGFFVIRYDNRDVGKSLLEGTGHEIHFNDWMNIINGIDKHINE